MRIAVLCSVHSLGDERVVCRQALSLARAGHEVVVYGRGDRGKSPPVHPNLRLVSITDLRRGKSLRARLSRVWALVGLFRTIRSLESDVLAAHEPDSALVALWLRRKRGTPVHFDVHELFDELVGARAPGWLEPTLRSLTWSFLSRVAARCDWITVVSSPMAERYAAVLTEERVTVLQNSAPMELFPPCDQSIDGPLTVCHEGWLNRSRGMREIVEALALARERADVRLLVVGCIRDNCEAEFWDHVDSLGLRDSVEVTGWLPYSEVGQADARAQVGLVTLQPSGNNYYGLSNKLFSYMACGQAVIVPRGSATADLAEECECGLTVDVTQPSALADAMVRLAGDPELRCSLGANARRAMERRYSWEQLEQVLISGYEALAAQRSATRS